MLKIEINTKPIVKRLSDIRDNLSDFSPLFSILRREFLQKRIREIFGTNGYGRWLPTTRPNPILRDTRALYRSYTQIGAAGNINIETSNSLIWGSDISYAHYHEYGTSRLTPREVISMLDTTEVTRITEEWVNSL